MIYQILTIITLLIATALCFIIGCPAVNEPPLCSVPFPKKIIFIREGQTVLIGHFQLPSSSPHSNFERLEEEGLE